MAERRAGWVPGRGAVLLAVVLAVAGAALLAPWWSYRERWAGSGVWSRYPELAGTDASRVHSVLTDERLVGHYDDSVDRLLRVRGASPRVVLRHLFDESLATSTVTTRADGSTHVASSYSEWEPGYDELRPTDAYLLRHPDPACDALIHRAAADRDLPFQLRFESIVCAARPGDPGGVPALVRVALDPGTPSALRRHALVRIPRCGARPVLALRRLLYDAGDDIDPDAALVLAACADLEAPSVVVREVEATRARLAKSDTCAGDTEALLCVAALRAAGPDGSALRTAAAEADAALRDWGRWVSSERRERAVTAYGAAADAFSAWLDATPAAFDTEYERRAREYRASDRYIAERALASWDDIVRCRDGDLDLGAAALVLADPERRDAQLERLRLLADGLADDVRAAASPREKLAVLNRLLPPDPATNDVRANTTSLSEVLSRRRGDCLGWTTLYLALGERLGLPLHGVLVPRHAFVRWDDGETRLNVDPVNHGAFRTDEEYAQEFDLNGPGDSGLRNRTPRDMLAYVCNNFSVRALDTWAREEAVEWARKALELHPGLDLAQVNLASALSCCRDVSTGEDAEAFADCAPALVRRGAKYPVVAQTFLWAGDLEHARAVLDASTRPAPLSASVTLAIAQGRTAEARHLLKVLEADGAWRNLTHAADRAIRWVEADAQALSGEMDTELRVELASILVCLQPDEQRGAASARAAIEVLEPDRAWFEERVRALRPDIRVRQRVGFRGSRTARAWFDAAVRARRTVGDLAGIAELEKLVFGDDAR